MYDKNAEEKLSRGTKVTQGVERERGGKVKVGEIR